MYYFKVRVDLDRVELDPIVASFAEVCSEYAYVVEGGRTHPHVHFYLKSKVKAPAIRQRLRSFNLGGNKDFAVATLREEYPVEYLAYMMKSGKVVTWHIPSEVLVAASERQEEVLRSMKEKELSKISWFKKCVIYVSENAKPEYHFRDTHVMSLLVDFYLANDKLLRDNVIISQARTISCMLNAKNVPNYKCHLSNRMTDKTF